MSEYSEANQEPWNLVLTSKYFYTMKKLLCTGSLKKISGVVLKFNCYNFEAKCDLVLFY